MLAISKIDKIFRFVTASKRPRQNMVPFFVDTQLT